MMARVKHLLDGNGKHYGWSFMCPGCNDHHVVTTAGKAWPGPEWEFNDNPESPTFSPSLRVRSNPNGRNNPGSVCHSFIREGKIQFLGDCTHKLAGQTVDLPEIQEAVKQ